MRLALVVAFICFALPAVAQDTIALAVEGWRAEERDGVTYYRCDSTICAAGSTVSYKEQPHRTTITMADFEKHHRGLLEQNKSNARIREMRLPEFKERLVEGVRVMQVAREVDWTSGRTVYSIEARLIGPGRSFSIVSDSTKREWTANNFEGFLRQLLVIAGVRKP